MNRDVTREQNIMIQWLRIHGMPERDAKTLTECVMRAYTAPTSESGPFATYAILQALEGMRLDLEG